MVFVNVWPLSVFFTVCVLFPERQIIGCCVSVDFFLPVCDRLQGYDNDSVCVCVCAWCVCQRQRSILHSHHFPCRQKRLTAVKCKIIYIKNNFFNDILWFLPQGFPNSPSNKNTAVTPERKHILRIFRSRSSLLGEASERKEKRRERKRKKRANTD